MKIIHKYKILMGIILIMLFSLSIIGCTGSGPEAVAKAFADSIVEKNGEKAITYMKTNSNHPGDAKLIVGVVAMGLSNNKSGGFTCVATNKNDSTATVAIKGSDNR